MIPKKMLEDACRRQDFAAMARFCTNVMDDGKYFNFKKMFY